MNASNVSQFPNDAQTDQVPKFLADFSDSDLRQLYSIGEVQQFAVGETVLSEGASDTSIYIIMGGEAEVSISTEKGWIRAAALIPGGVFGELSLFDRMPRSARVSVLSACTVLKISESSFQSLRDNNTGMALALAMELGKILSLRVRRMNQLIQALAR